MNFPRKNPLLFCRRIGRVLTARLGDSPSWSDPVRLAEAFSDLSLFLGDRSDVRVLVLSGFDQSRQGQLAEASTPKVHPKPRIPEFLSITKHVASWSIPVIAAIEGTALGLALEVILACDLRVADDSSRFGFPCIRQGLIPWDGGSQRLSRIVGAAKALELLLTGEEIPAREAQRIGLIHKVVPSSGAMEAALHWAKDIAQKAPAALRFAKEAVLQGSEMTLEQGVKMEADLYFLLQTTRDREEGIQAFRQKRRSRFEGK